MTCVCVCVVCLVTVARQVGKALMLAPLPLAVADVEANRHGAGYPLIAVRRDFHHQRSLQTEPIDN